MKLNQLPRSKLRGIKYSDQIVEKRELTTVYLVVRFALFLHIFPNYLFISVLPYGVGIVAAGPEFPSPQHLLHFRMYAKYLPCGDTLDNLYDHLRRHYGYTLDKKMHMVLVRSNFNEMDFVPV